MLACLQENKHVIKVYSIFYLLFCYMKTVRDIVPGVLASGLQTHCLFWSRTEIVLLACCSSRSVMVVEAATLASIFWLLPFFPQCISHLQFCIHLSHLHLISYHSQYSCALFMDTQWKVDVGDISIPNGVKSSYWAGKIQNSPG